MRKSVNWIAIAVSLLPFFYLLVVWPSLPQVVPVHFDHEMKPDRMGDKSELFVVVSIMFAVSLFVFFLLKNIHRFDPKRKDAEDSPVFHKLALGLTIFMSVLTILIINSATQSVLFKTALFPLIGLLFAFIGYYMNHLPPNYFAGIRLPWTLSDNENWQRTHRFASKFWVAGGLLIALGCFFLPLKFAFIFFIVVTIILVLIPIVYSYRLFKKQP